MQTLVKFNYRYVKSVQARSFFYCLHSDKAAQIVSKRVDDFRERNIPQVGVVHDPIKETLKVDSDHTYGIMVTPDEFGAGDLIHMRDATNFLRGRDRQRGILAAVRQNLKKANYQNFRDLKEAFAFYDKVGIHFICSNIVYAVAYIVLNIIDNKPSQTILKKKYEGVFCNHSSRSTRTVAFRKIFAKTILEKASKNGLCKAY